MVPLQPMRTSCHRTDGQKHTILSLPLFVSIGLTWNSNESLLKWQQTTCSYCKAEPLPPGTRHETLTRLYSGSRHTVATHMTFPSLLDFSSHIRLPRPLRSSPSTRAAAAILLHTLGTWTRLRLTHTHIRGQKETTGNQEKEKRVALGGGAVKQTYDWRPCFQSNPLFVLQDLYL